MNSAPSSAGQIKLLFESNRHGDKRKVNVYMHTHTHIILDSIESNVAAVPKSNEPV